MMDFVRMTRVYRAVNVAGRLNDRWLEPGELAAKAAMSRFSLRQRQIRRGQQGRAQMAPGGAGPGRWPSLQKARHALQDGPAYALAQLQFGLAASLAVQRGFPLFALPEPQAPRPVVPFWHMTPMYPLAEMLVGRGQNIDSATFDLHIGFVDAIHQKHREWSQYGLFGRALERAPVRAAQSYRRQGRDRMAVACMGAAVCGRVLLQGPRLVIGTVAFVRELKVAAIVMGLQLGLEVGLRLTRCALQLLVSGTDARWHPVANRLDRAIAFFAGDRDDWVQQFVDLRSAGAEPGDGATGNNARVRQYCSRLMQQFAAIEVTVDAEGNEDAETLERVRETAATVVAKLRHFCRDFANDEALRGGLAMLRDFLVITYGDQAVPFAPPELTERTR